MLIFGDAPLNIAQWAVAAIVLMIFTYKSWASYRYEKNALAFYFTVFGFLVSLSLSFYGFPGLFSRNPQLIYTFNLYADTLLYLGLLVQARIFWHILNPKSKRKMFLDLGIILLGSLAVWGSIQYGYVEFRGNLAVYVTPLVSYGGRALMMAVLLLPVGYFFIKKSLSQKLISAKAKSFGIGSVYLGVGLSTVYRDLVLKGIDNLAYINLNLLFFLIFFLTLVFTIPKRTS